MAQVLVKDAYPSNGCGPKLRVPENRPIRTSWSQHPDSSRSIPAWALSISLHLALLILLAGFVRVTYRGVAMEPARQGGIVLAHNSGTTTQYFGEEDKASESTTQTTQSAADSLRALPGRKQQPIDLAGRLPTRTSDTIGSQAGMELPSASGFATGSRPSGGRLHGNQVRTSIFGVEGTGTKFVYVFDRSASMADYGGRPMAAAKAELTASLDDLGSMHQFQIIFYNDRSTVFNPRFPQPPKMLYGDDSTCRLAQNFVHAVVAAGGTRHMEALKLALGMRPDVIFFLTDAAEPRLSPSELAEIHRLDTRIGAMINTIEFGAGAYRNGNNFLVQLAQQNGGQHAYIDITRLPQVR